VIFWNISFRVIPKDRVRRYRMKHKEFKTIRSEREENGRFAVVRDLVEVGDCTQPFFYTDIREGVCVLAFFEGKIILLREYRYPVRSWQWEIPGGIVDPGEDPQHAAVRELKEETGFEVDGITSLGAVYTSFGSSNEKINLFLAICQKRGENDPEPAEVFDLYLKDEEEFRKMVLNGEFMHGAGLAAWARYLTGRRDRP
jgi:ADP-ribose pyrophosphatase